jgi:drug/metabolite transporter (DMT)-like permease
VNSETKRDWLQPQWWWSVAAGMLVGIALRLVFSAERGEPLSSMSGSFALCAPIVVGAVAVYVAELRERRTWAYYFGLGAMVNVLFVLGTFAILIEGAISSSSLRRCSPCSAGSRACWPAQPAA